MTVDLTDAEAREHHGKPLRLLCVQMIRNALECRLWPLHPTAYRGLALRYSGRFLRETRVHPPFGWVVRRLHEREKLLLMPCWLLPVHWIASGQAVRAWYCALLLTGLYECEEDGYLNEGWWRWDFWRSTSARTLRQMWREGTFSIL